MHCRIAESNRKIFEPRHRDEVRVLCSDACEAAAKLIAEGRVIAWYRGRMEYGPRALGNRSILADPGHPAMRDRINAMVKMREAFRPFAPACSVEQAPHWFSVPPGTHMPYMITVVDVRPEHRTALPAITHVNGSARLQTVSAKDNPDFHRLLKAVGKTTGREMVLNTSFNVKGSAHRQYTRRSHRDFLGHWHRISFSGEPTCCPQKRLIAMTLRPNHCAPRRWRKAFERQAALTPDAVALVSAGRRLTYRELDQLSNQLARYLQQVGVGPEILTGIAIERSVEMMVGLLAILKAGGAYVPIDPSFPAQRISLMIEDSQAPVILATEDTKARLPRTDESHCFRLMAMRARSRRILSTHYLLLP